MNVGIVAALPGELKPLVRGWTRGAEGADGVWRGTIGGAACFAVAAGMGAAAATRGVEQVCAAAGMLDAVLSLGWAGALTGVLRAPSACIVGEVVESRTGERYRLAPPVGPTLVTADRVIASADKPALAARYGAALVDMEAATIARLATARGVRFLCVKGISDNVEDQLPDFNRFTDSRGQLRMPVFLAHVMLRPRYWAGLKLLGINSKRAAEALAEQVPLCLRAAGLIS